MALRLGLTLEPQAHPRLGFYRTDLGEGAREFLQKIGFNEQAFQLGRKQAIPGFSVRSVQPWICSCGTKIRTARANFDVRCNECGQNFMIDISHFLKDLYDFGAKVRSK